MYCIIVYDISVERVNKVCQFLKTYLNWIQNSVFEGEIDDISLIKIRDFLDKTLDKSSDSVIIYKLRSSYDFSKEVIGIQKSNDSQII